MASAELNRRVEKVVGHAPFMDRATVSGASPRGAARRRELEDLPGKWQAAILETEGTHRRLRPRLVEQSGPLPGETPGTQLRLSWAPAPMLSEECAPPATRLLWPRSSRVVAGGVALAAGGGCRTDRRGGAGVAFAVGEWLVMAQR
jgi:hypothetical protein